MVNASQGKQVCITTTVYASHGLIGLAVDGANKTYESPGLVNS